MADGELRVVYRIEESRAGQGYQAHCPELLVTAFGDTVAEARLKLRQQITDYLADCEAQGSLEETLTEAGFVFDGEVWVSSLAERDPRFLRLPESSDDSGESAGSLE